MVKHIVWDWNGTIFDDGGALIDATIDTFARAGLPPITAEAYRRHFTQPIPLFYNRLAGRPLSEAELAGLAEQWGALYESMTPALTSDAVHALEAWAGSGGTQSLLSMYRHDRLVPLVREAGLARYFRRVDGKQDVRSFHLKAPFLRAHLERLELAPEQAFVVGDSVDDMLAARECGVPCAAYWSGATAQHAREHLSRLGVPLVESLLEAVEVARELSAASPPPVRG